MRRTDGVDTHGLELQEFAVQGVLIECSTQTTEVVVLADTVELEVLAVEPEARLGIEPKVAEACGCLHLINHLSTYQQLRAYLIYIRIFTRPLFEVRGEG